MNRPEQKLHQSCVKWLRIQHPGVLFMHPYNGGYRRPFEARIASSLGLLPGAADLFIFIPGQLPLAIEFKADKGRQSDTQKAFQQSWETIGGSYVVIKDLPTFMVTVNKFIARV